MMIYLLPEELATLLSEIHRVMKPGAYLEVVDTNYTIRRAGPLSNSIINTECKIKYKVFMKQKKLNCIFLY